MRPLLATPEPVATGRVQVRGLDGILSELENSRVDFACVGKTLQELRKRLVCCYPPCGEAVLVRRQFHRGGTACSVSAEFVPRGHGPGKRFAT